MPLTDTLAGAIGVFVAAAVVIAICGSRLSAVGDHLADRTGWGEAVFGAVFFGGVISASGIVMTVTASLHGHPSLAYSNAVGGIAAQTAVLAVADTFHRGTNLEHAAASQPNMFSAALLIFLLAVGLGGSLSPEVAIWGIHPVSFTLVVAYLYGLRHMRAVNNAPAWTPKQTTDTVPDEPDEEGPQSASTTRLWIEFAVFGTLVCVAGWVATLAAESIMKQTALGATVVGALLLGITNALPEAVTSIAAVRRGALTLAMAGVVGGNTFDVLNLVAGDVAYRSGSLYHAAKREDLFVTILALAMTAVLLAGLIRRERRGLGNIGFESALLLLLYVGGMVIVALA